MIYREVRPDGKRTFALQGATLTIKGVQFLRSSFEQTVSLADADPNTILVWVRPKLFFSLLYLTTFFAVGGGIARGAGWATDENFVDIVLWGFAAVLFLISLFCFRKIRFIQFRNKSGIVLFDVAQAGPDRRTYDDFIAAIKSAVASTRA